MPLLIHYRSSVLQFNCIRNLCCSLPYWLLHLLWYKRLSLCNMGYFFIWCRLKYTKLGLYFLVKKINTPTGKIFQIHWTQIQPSYITTLIKIYFTNTHTYFCFTYLECRYEFLFDYSYVVIIQIFVD